MHEQRRSQVAHAILEYLWNHPDAQDTLSGISQWWLPDESLRSRATSVEEALADLVSAGLVVERRSKDSQVHYGINRSKLQRVRAFLKQNRKK